MLMLHEETKILKLNQCQKSDKGPFITNSDFRFLIEKTDRCKNNPERSNPEQK